MIRNKYNGIAYYSNIACFTNDYNFQIIQVTDTVKPTLFEKSLTPYFNFIYLDYFC